MENTQKNAYIEVGQILDILGNDYRMKIPKKVRKLFPKNQKTNYKFSLNSDIKIEDIQISRTALIIISILNLKYWETDLSKKEELKNKYYANEKIYQDKINIYKQDDWLKKETIETPPTDLIVKNDISIFEKIKNFFSKLIHKRK